MHCTLSQMMQTYLFLRAHETPQRLIVMKFFRTKSSRLYQFIQGGNQLSFVTIVNLTCFSCSKIMYRYPLGVVFASLFGHSILMLPKGLNAEMRVCSVMSQGTPPKKILQESGAFPCIRGGSWPDQVQVASFRAENKSQNFNEHHN